MKKHSLSHRRVKTIALVAIAAALSAAIRVAPTHADATPGSTLHNLMPSATFQPGPNNWLTAGQDTTAVVDTDVRHGTGNALKVTDRGIEMGQSTTPRIPVKSGEIYYAEAWVRLDPQLRDRGSVDIEFFDGDRYLGALMLGEVATIEWKRIAGSFPVAEGATSMVLRFMPAISANLSVGAGWIDDVVIARVGEAEMSQVAPALAVPPNDPDNQHGAAPRDIRPTWFSHPPTVDFENMAGWNYTIFPPTTGRFARSQGMPLAGDWVGHLEYSSPEGSGWARLTPPHPIPIREPFDHAQVWVHGEQRDRGVILVAVVRDADGKMHNISLGAVTWPDWSIADVRLHEPIPVPATLERLEVWGLHTASAAPESVYLDNLAFYRESTNPIALSLPPAGSPYAVRLPVRESSILPSPPAGVAGRVEREGDVWRFVASGAGEPVEYRYEPHTGTLADLTVSGGGKEFAPCSGGGIRLLLSGKEYAPGDPALQARWIGPAQVISGRNPATEFRFQVTDGKETAQITYQLSLSGRSLIIDARCDRATGMQAGRPLEATGFTPLLVPYLTYGYGGTPVMARRDGTFASWLWDYYRSDASELSNTDTSYLPRTDGQRNALRERLVLTFSRQLEDVLPNIPNPAATQAPKAIGEVYCAIQTASSQVTDQLRLWQQLKAYGVDHLIAKQHAEVWSPGSGTGPVPFFQNPHASSSIPGGDQALAAYVKAVRALGYRYAFYTDYVLNTPVQADWSEDDVSRNSNDEWKRAWYQAFMLTPLRSWQRAAHYAPLIARLGNNASYCDEHTSGPPWGFTDYDARKPFAAMFRPVMSAYAAVFQAERQAYNGPVWSEGNHHWMMAGLCDGSYAQFHPDDRPAYRVPLLVDFDLRKMHPLEMDLGMGWQAAYGLSNDFDPTGAANDRLLAATIAFGHAGLLYAPWNAPYGNLDPANPMGKYKEIMLRTYFMTQQAQSRYLMRPVSRIEYHNGTGFVDASAAITSGAIEHSHVHVVYDNGLEVWANGGLEGNWEITVGDQHVVLPPAGYAVYQAGQVREHSSLVDGRRVDFAATPAYLYADARGRQTDFGPLRLSGAAVVKPEGAGFRVIGITPEQTIVLRVADLPFHAPTGAARRITWEDETGARRQNETLQLNGGVLTLRFPAWAHAAVVE